MFKKEDLRKVTYTLMSKTELEQKGSAAIMQYQSYITPKEGLFHGWAIDSKVENTQQGPVVVHQTTALIEDVQNKNVIKVRSDLVTFIN